ncbi:MAG: hypothetical protein DMG78_15770 [Acidobacteria bacterium]|nr:MAG: hypothetical protein DMG78_15770 [Acidobacteriota bacterium]
MGGVSRQTCAATFPPDRFYCLLDELPVHLVPRPALTLKSQNAGRALFLNPECRLCAGEEVPEELAPHKELPSVFALQGTVAWLRSANTSFLVPFWLGPKLESVVRQLRIDEPIPESVPAWARSILKSADRH